jgi:hypothetical protein
MRLQKEGPMNIDDAKKYLSSQRGELNKYVETLNKFQDRLRTPPPTKPYSKVKCEKWDNEVARNVLLHFIEIEGLSEQCNEFLEAFFPDEREMLEKLGES